MYQNSLKKKKSFLNQAMKKKNWLVTDTLEDIGLSERTKTGMTCLKYLGQIQTKNHNFNIQCEYINSENSIVMKYV